MTLPLYELFVRPDFGDAPVDEHDNRRASWNGVVSMRGEENHLGLSHLSKELKDRALSLGVQTCYRLVQDHHGGILIDQARQGQALPLSAGEIKLTSESCSDQGIDPVR
jgi:hypothetical protein